MFSILRKFRIEKKKRFFTLSKFSLLALFTLFCFSIVINVPALGGHLIDRFGPGVGIFEYFANI